MPRRKTKKESNVKKEELQAEQKRIAVIVCHENGLQPNKIFEATGVPVRSVYATLKRWRETGTWKDRPRSRRPATSVTPANINRVDLPSPRLPPSLESR